MLRPRDVSAGENIQSAYGNIPTNLQGAFYSQKCIFLYYTVMRVVFTV